MNRAKVNVGVRLWFTHVWLLSCTGASLIVVPLGCKVQVLVPLYNVTLHIYCPSPLIRFFSLN